MINKSRLHFIIIYITNNEWFIIIACIYILIKSLFPKFASVFTIYKNNNISKFLIRNKLLKELKKYS